MALWATYISGERYTLLHNILRAAPEKMFIMLFFGLRPEVLIMLFFRLSL